jgi:hypothetical protein
MTSPVKIDRGGGITYSTKPVGAGVTNLLIQPWYDDQKMCTATECTWHIELDKQDDHKQAVKPEDTGISIDISQWPGALVSVRNTGVWPFTCWTDYY